MKVELKRIFRGPKYTIGHLYVNGKYVCDTLEDTDRGFTQAMSVRSIMAKKIKGETAIPVGTYLISMTIKSPRFSKNDFYNRICDGKLPRLVEVPGYDGVLIHCGNTEKDTEGCILVGYNKIKGQVINSRSAFEDLYSNYLKVAEGNRERIILEIS